MSLLLWDHPEACCRLHEVLRPGCFDRILRGKVGGLEEKLKESEVEKEDAVRRFQESMFWRLEPKNFKESNPHI